MDPTADASDAGTGAPGTERLTSAEMALRGVLLVAQRGRLTVRELARELDIAPSTAHRILSRCRRAGFVRQDNHGGPYLVGAAMHEIALTVTGARNLRDAAGPVLAQLQIDTGASIAFYILEGRHARVVDVVPGGPARVTAPALGRLVPAHCTAGGKALLSRDTPEDLRRRFPGKVLSRHTDRTITSWGTLLAELARVRKRGWALSVGEFEPSLTGIAAPVSVSTGRAVGAVVLTGHASTLCTRPEIDALAPAVVEAAETITARLRSWSSHPA